MDAVIWLFNSSHLWTNKGNNFSSAGFVVGSANIRCVFSLVPRRLSKLILSCLPGASQVVQVALSYLPGASQAIQLILSCLLGALPAVQ